MEQAIRFRIRRYPLPGESAFGVVITGGDESPYAGGGGLGDAERGCGFREEGGTYACVPLTKSGDGAPVESFMLCQPFPVDPDEYGLTALGTKLIDLPETCLLCKGSGERVISLISNAATVRDCPECKGLGLVTVTHVWDIIGREYYPNVADFLEEARACGISRRLGFTEATDYARLTERSRLFLLHSRAIIGNPQDYYNAMGAAEAEALSKSGACPKNHSQHAINLAAGDVFTPTQAVEAGHILTPYRAEAPGCAALWWHDLEITDGVEWGDPLPPGFVKRTLPSFHYGGYLRGEGIKPLHSLGVFAIFPLARLEIVDPSGGDEYNAAIERASAAKLPVRITDC